MLLAATPREDNVLLTVNLTNADVRGEGGRVILPRGTLHITRSRYIWDGVCHELLRVRNFALSTVNVELVVRFYSDFENIVDVRSQRRADAARRRYERVEPDSVTQSCLGPDEVLRETMVDCHTTPEAISADSLRYRLQIGSRGEKTISLAIGCSSQNRPVQIATFTRSLAAAEELARREGPRPRKCTLRTRLQRLAAPRRRGPGMLLTTTPQAACHTRPSWLDAAFGRDASSPLTRHSGCGLTLRATCCVFSRPRSARTAPAATVRKPARSSTRRAVHSRQTTMVWTPPTIRHAAGAYYARTADRSSSPSCGRDQRGAALDRRVW